MSSPFPNAVYSMVGPLNGTQRTLSISVGKISSTDSQPPRRFSGTWRRTAASAVDGYVPLTVGLGAMPPLSAVRSRFGMRLAIASAVTPSRSAPPPRNTFATMFWTRTR